jgi:hypothetical protein
MVVLGVTGQKSVEMSARIADGAILSEWVGWDCPCFG